MVIKKLEFKDILNDWVDARELSDIPTKTILDEELNMYLSGIIHNSFSKAPIYKNRRLSNYENLIISLSPTFHSSNEVISLEAEAKRVFLLSGFLEDEIEETRVMTENEVFSIHRHTPRSGLIEMAETIFNTLSEIKRNPTIQRKREVMKELGRNLMPYGDTLSRLYENWGIKSHPAYSININSILKHN